jgi:hypothetical protein
MKEKTKGWKKSKNLQQGNEYLVSSSCCCCEEENKKENTSLWFNRDEWMKRDKDKRWRRRRGKGFVL